MITAMKDNYGREITYLRVSVTTRCNLNCVYCGKESCEKREAELSAEEIFKIVSAFSRCGIKKVRITGGEPLVRKDVAEIVSRIRSIPEIETIALTTNGVYLAENARKLFEAGLNSVNVSLDSTDGSTYRKLTGADVLKKVLEGIDEAERVGLSPIKINAVLMKGVNDDGAGELIGLARKKPIDVRFIELMPFSESGEDASLLVTGDDILKSFPFLHPIESEAGAARYYSAEGFLGRVGFISPVSHKFCSECNRIRLLSDGRVKPCLSFDEAFDVMPFINNEHRLIKEIKRIIKLKPAGHNFGTGERSRGLNRTGG